MLPAEHRMRNSAEFRDTIGAGRRAGRRTVVVHIRPADPADPGATGPSRVGFVVSKKVGNAVVRNRVRRRLRHLMRPLIATGPAPASVVVRALPAAASQPARMADDLADAYRRAAGVL